VEAYKAKWSLLDDARRRLIEADAAYHVTKKYGSEEERRALRVRIAEIEAEIAARDEEVTAMMQDLMKSGEFPTSPRPQTG